MILSIIILISITVGGYCGLLIKRFELFYQQIQPIKSHSIIYSDHSKDTYFLFVQKETILGDIKLLYRIVKLIRKKNPILSYDLRSDCSEDVQLANELHITALPAIFKKTATGFTEVLSFKMLYDHPEMTDKDILKYLQKEVI